MPTELQQHAEGDDRDKIEEGLVKKELGFNVDPGKMEGIYRTLNGSPVDFLHFPSQERLAFSKEDEDDGIVTKLDSTSISGAGLIGVDETNLHVVNTGTGNLQNVLDRIDEAIGHNNVQYQFDDQNGTISEQVKSHRSYFSQFTNDAGATNHEVVDYQTVGPQLLKDPTFASGSTYWPISGGTGWTFGGGKANYNPTGMGSISQSAFAIKPFPNRWHRFKYTITVPPNTPTPSENALPRLTTTFAAGANVKLPIGSNTLYVKSGTGSPALAFTILGSTLGFSISDLELAEVVGGDSDVHGSLSVGRDILIKKEKDSNNNLSHNPAGTTYPRSGGSFKNIAGSLKITAVTSLTDSVGYVKILADKCTEESIILTTLELTSGNLGSTLIHVIHRIYEKKDGYFIVEFSSVGHSFTHGGTLTAHLLQEAITSSPMVFSWVIINTSINDTSI